MDTWASQIKRIRKDRGERQDEFALVIGKSTNTVSMWERGETVPSKHERERILAIVDPVVVFDRFCLNCVHFDENVLRFEVKTDWRPKFYYPCKLHPETVDKDHGDWCGDFEGASWHGR